MSPRGLVARVRADAGLPGGREPAAAVAGAGGGSGGVALPRRGAREIASSDAALLSIGTLCSGLLAYAFNVLAARALGPELYGPIAVLWAAVFLTAVVLFRPLEQTLSRSIAERTAQEVDARPVVRSVVRLAVVISGLALTACIVAWEPITDGLFAGQPLLTAALAVAIVGYCLSYLVRGLVGGVRWFGGYGILLLADGGVRVVIALPLIALASPELAAAAIAAAAIGGAIAPLLVRRRGVRRSLQQPRQAPFAMREALGFAVPATAIAASEQVLVSGGPLLVMLAGGPDAAAAAGVVFAATMLVRAPVFLFQGVSAALLPSLTRLDALGDRLRFRHAVVRTVLVLAVFSGLLVAGALAVGPQAMDMLYGSGFEATRLDLAILCTGIGCYLLAATLSQAVLARGQARWAGSIWAVAAVAFVAIELTVSGAALHRVSVAFALASALMAALFVALITRRISFKN
jgi:O-antigen/teichoic acid export membrane protein